MGSCLIESIDKVAKANGLSPFGNNSAKGTYEGANLKMLYSVDECGSTEFTVIGMPSGLFFVRYPEKKMEEIKKSLMNELGHRFKDMEFVIPIQDQ